MEPQPVVALSCRDQPRRHLTDRCLDFDSNAVLAEMGADIEWELPKLGSRAKNKHIYIDTQKTAWFI